MPIDVETPNPPDLTNRPLPSSLVSEDLVDGTEVLRRSELEELLAEGAWNEAFLEWSEYTDLTESEFRVIEVEGIIEQLDIFWNPIEKRLNFDVPSISMDDVGSRNLALKASSELVDLCQTVVETLEETYVDWGNEASGEEDWSETTFSNESPLDE